MAVSDPSGPLQPEADPSPAAPGDHPGAGQGRFRWLIGYLVVLAVLFARPLWDLVYFAVSSELYSHILLIPFISLYWVRSDWRKCPATRESSPGLAAVPLTIGVLLLLAYWVGVSQGWVLSQNDYLAMTIFALLLFVTGGLLAFVGRGTVRVMTFPLALLVFAVPMPTLVLDGLEVFFQHTSAQAAFLLFKMSDTPVLRQDLVFYLPGLSIKVATECSGIRSSLVLFITSLLAGRLFLNSPWRRALLAFAVIPLGIIRNGIRIFTVSMLTIHVNPSVINGPLHHRGGPVFFALSLVPFFALLWWLRRSERKGRSKK